MISAAVFLCFAFSAAVQSPSDWTAVTPGIEFRWLSAKTQNPAGNARIALVRIDPAQWQLELACQKQSGDSTGRTAAQWAKKSHFAAAINAGMFSTDYLTHTGYMASRGLVYSRGINSYQSVAAFDPYDSKHSARFRMFDLDSSGITIPGIKKSYASCVQNLRLIKRPGKNCWPQQEKKWSEAALGEDRNGRILFIFCRSPFSMFDFNNVLLSADIGLVALQHLEGGPEAQLYLHAGSLDIDICGSYETSFRENDGNGTAWPIPNVLGVKRRGPAK
jgi:hypothetical protein